MTGMEDSFGHCVSINGDYALVGDYYGNDFKGAAYVFKRIGTNWIEDAKLTASDPEKFSLFGDSISIDGEYVIVGADCDGSTGAAYIFKNNGTNWIEEAKLLASDGGDDVFGCSVSIDGEHAIIGAYFDNDNGKWSGSAYVFTKDLPPSAPEIDGPSGVPPGTYEWTFKSIDPDGDDVKYYIDWGDGKAEETAFHASGEEVTISHTYTSQGDYIISSCAEDIYGAVGPVGTNPVLIPRSTQQSKNPLILRLLEQFPLLERLLNLI
jgi:hypothetical protein